MRMSVGTRRRFVVAAVLALCLAVCSGGRHPIQTPLGNTLDCPSDLVAFSTVDLLADAVGYNEPQSAAEAFTGWGRPEGGLSIEEETGDEVTFVLTDPEGNRLGRLIVSKTDHGWFVMQAEQCGEEP